jgi:hypothetical protein
MPKITKAEQKRIKQFNEAEALRNQQFSKTVFSKIATTKKHRTNLTAKVAASGLDAAAVAISALSSNRRDDNVYTNGDRDLDEALQFCLGEWGSELLDLVEQVVKLASDSKDEGLASEAIEGIMLISASGLFPELNGRLIEIIRVLEGFAGDSEVGHRQQCP